MSALIVIPARLGSSRLPQKPLRDLGGRPLVVRVLERVTSMRMDAEIVVAADDERVAEAVRQAGGTAVLTRTDHSSGTDRVAEVARLAAYRGHDLLINVQGDEPFVSAAAISAARVQAESGGFGVGTVACADDPAILAQPSIVKVVRDASGRALYFSRAPIPFARDDGSRSMRDANVLRHVGIYAYRRNALLKWVSLPPLPLEQIEQLEQLRPLEAGIPIGVGLAPWHSPGIDTEDDLRRANESWLAGADTAIIPTHAGTG